MYPMGGAARRTSVWCRGTTATDTATSSANAETSWYAADPARRRRTRPWRPGGIRGSAERTLCTALSDAVQYPMSVRLPVIVCVLAIAVPVGVGPVAADPVVDGRFAVGGVGTNNQITIGPDANVWVTLDATNDVARIAPDGTVTQFNPVNLNSPRGSPQARTATSG